MSEKASPECTHRLPTDLRQRICEWFNAIQTAAYDEELEWLVVHGLSDPDYDSTETTEEEARQIAAEFVEADLVIEQMLAKCGRSTLECAIIEALLVENGFEQVKVQEEGYSWLWPEARLNRLHRGSQSNKPSNPPAASA